jgi:hypothetical protein
VEIPQSLFDGSAFDISRAEFDALLGRLCVHFGFCLSAPKSERLWDKRLQTVDEFVDALYVADGLKNDTRRDLRRAVKSEVQQFIASRRLP